MHATQLSPHMLVCFAQQEPWNCVRLVNPGKHLHKYASHATSAALGSGIFGDVLFKRHQNRPVGMDMFLQKWLIPLILSSAFISSS